MMQNIFLQADYKFNQYLYQLDIIIRLRKMVVMIKLNRGDNPHTSDINFSLDLVGYYKF